MVDLLTIAYCFPRDLCIRLKTLIQGNEEGLDDYVETALDQHTLLGRTTVSLCMTHNPGGYERITIGWFTYHTALMLVHMFILNLDGG